MALTRSITLGLDQTGAYAGDSSFALEISWVLMAGSNYVGTVVAWTTGSFIASTNQFNFMASTSNVFELFDVGMYEGNVAPSFQVPDSASELASCKRYYAKTTASARFPASASNQIFDCQIPWPMEMRAPPTVVLGAGSRTNLSGGAPTVANIDTLGCRFEIISAAAGDTVAVVIPVAMNARM